MSLTGLKLAAGLAALATMGLVACGDDMQTAENEIPTVAPTTEGTLDPASVPTPPDPLPSAPPELIAPQAPLDPTDPTAPPPGAPPPVLPDSPPN
jgi:hypothetical protein